MNHEVETVANEHCGCGENPLWDEINQYFYWTDIPNGRLFRLDATSGEWQRIYDGAVVGGFTLQQDGSLLLFRDHDIALRDDDSSVKVLLSGCDAEAGRFNDVVADPAGRVFAGTMGVELKGGVYLVEPDLSVKKVQGETNCSNGQDFSLDLKTYYWSESTAKKIYSFEYDQSSGEIANRKVLFDVPDDWGINDGLKIDSEGCLWVAFYDGSAVRRFSPEGQLMETIKILAPKVTSVIFGGAALDELFITTAGGEDGSDSLDGALFRLRPGVKGRVSFRSKMNEAI
ncbi:MAG: SMP-30/gluconolactonase/LRE family protein [Abditibacteriaceae bacterium]